MDVYEEHRKIAERLEKSNEEVRKANRENLIALIISGITITIVLVLILARKP